MKAALMLICRLFSSQWGLSGGRGDKAALSSALEVSETWHLPGPYILQVAVDFPQHQNINTVSALAQSEFFIRLFSAEKVIF